MAEAETIGEWRRTSPVAVVFYIFSFLRRLLTDGLPALAPVTAAFAASESLLWSWFGLAAGVGAVLLTAWSVLSWLRFRFRLSDGLVQVRRGVLHREQLSIDFDRVQNVNIREPAYMRPFGLATLAIDTAGSAGKEVSIAGLQRPLALDLRGAMLARSEDEEPLRSAGDDAVSDGDDEPVATPDLDGELLLTRSTRDIAIYGLTASSLVWVAVVIGFVISAVESASDAWGAMLTRVAQQAVLTGAKIGLNEVAVGIAVAVGVIILLPLLSIAGALFRHHDYTLRFDGETYRRASGLLSRHDESVKQHKIQEVVWRQNFIARWFRRVNLKLAVARAGQAAEVSGSGIPMPGQSFVVPSLTEPEAAALTGHFLPGCEAGEIDFSRVDGRRYVLRYLAYGWSLPVLGVSVAPTIFVHPAFALLVPVGFGLGAAILYQLWRRIGYAVNGQYAFLREGFIGSKTSVFPLFKLQRVDLRQTPGQRRAGVAHLTLHLASGTFTLPYIGIDDAERLRDLALYHAESDPRPWF